MPDREGGEGKGVGVHCSYFYREKTLFIVSYPSKHSISKITLSNTNNFMNTDCWMYERS